MFGWMYSNRFSGKENHRFVCNPVIIGKNYANVVLDVLFKVVKRQVQVENTAGRIADFVDIARKYFTGVK
jgi:hypothetical protein